MPGLVRVADEVWPVGTAASARSRSVERPGHGERVSALERENAADVPVAEDFAQELRWSASCAWHPNGKRYTTFVTKRWLVLYWHNPLSAARLF